MTVMPITRDFTRSGFVGAASGKTPEIGGPAIEIPRRILFVPPCLR